MLTLVIQRLQYQERGLTIPKKDYKTHKTRALDHNIVSLYLYETYAYVSIEVHSIIHFHILRQRLLWKYVILATP